MPFRENMRYSIDKILLELNRILIKKGFSKLPLELYSTFNKTNQELLHTSENKVEQKPVETRNMDEAESALAMDGTEMLLEQYAKYFEVEDKYGDFKASLKKLPLVRMK